MNRNLDVFWERFFRETLMLRVRWEAAILTNGQAEVDTLLWRFQNWKFN